MNLDFIKHNKIILGGVVVVVLALLYFAFFSGGSATPALTSSADSGASAVSQSLLTTLASLNTIRLDNSIFSNAVFVSLTDFGVVIPPENVGRQNPFAPLPGSTIGSGNTLPTGQ